MKDLFFVPLVVFFISSAVVVHGTTDPAEEVAELTPILKETQKLKAMFKRYTRVSRFHNTIC